MYIFWPIFFEKSEQPTKEQRENNEDPRKYWEIKFAWSEYKNKKWSPKKVSKDFLRSNRDPTPHAPQEPHDYSFKTRVRQGITGEQLSIECYGTTIGQKPPRTDSVNTTTTTTTNSQKIVSYYKAPTQASYWYWLKVYKDGWNLLQPAEIDDIKILMRSSATGTLYQTIKLDGNGEYPSFGGFVTITEPVDFYLESTTKQIKSVSDKWGFTGGLGVSIDLKAWSPTTTTTTTTQQVPGGPAFNPMQGLGEFTLDSCNGNLVLVQGPLALVPASLQPIAGTQLQNMTMVDLNSFDAMGNSAVLGRTPGTFRLLGSHQAQDYTATYISLPFFYQDESHAYAATRLPGGKVRFSAFYHPTICKFTVALNRLGVEGLLTLENQRVTDNAAAFSEYQPDTSKVDADFPREDVDFAHEGAYANYQLGAVFPCAFSDCDALEQESAI